MRQACEIGGLAQAFAQVRAFARGMGGARGQSQWSARVANFLADSSSKASSRRVASRPCPAVNITPRGRPPASAANGRDRAGVPLMLANGVNLTQSRNRSSTVSYGWVGSRCPMLGVGPDTVG